MSAVAVELSEQVSVMPPTRRNGAWDDVQRTLGELLKSVEHISEQMDESRKDRHRMHAIVENLDRKVDPLVIQVEALERTAQIHEVAIRSIEDRRIEFGAIRKAGRWLLHFAYLAAVSLALIWSDYIKFPLSKLLGLWKLQ